MAENDDFNREPEEPVTREFRRIIRNNVIVYQCTRYGCYEVFDQITQIGWHIEHVHHGSFRLETYKQLLEEIMFYFEDSTDRQRMIDNYKKYSFDMFPAAAIDGLERGFLASIAENRKLLAAHVGKGNKSDGVLASILALGPYLCRTENPPQSAKANVVINGEISISGSVTINGEVHINGVTKVGGLKAEAASENSDNSKEKLVNGELEEMEEKQKPPSSGGRRLHESKKLPKK